MLFLLLARSGFTRSVFIFCLSCVWLNQIGVAALSVKIEALEKEVSADSVDRALVCVRQLAGRPVGNLVPRVFVPLDQRVGLRETLG